MIPTQPPSTAPLPEPPEERAWCCRSRQLPWGKRTLVMGIVNVTPDSFFDGGRYAATDAAISQGQALAAAGADILDIGGESSRPGAEPVSAEEESRRVIPVIQALADTTDAALSIDTYKPEVAQAALATGVHIVNDITAGRADPAMYALVAQYKAGLILMHMQGEPRTMQEQPTYTDVVGEVCQFLAGRMFAAKEAGVSHNQLAVDPGIGFGKAFDHNWDLLCGLDSLCALNAPVLIGASRKRFLGDLCGRSVKERLPASLAVAAWAAEHGAAIIRTHDVKETCDVMRVVDRLRHATKPMRIQRDSC